VINDGVSREEVAKARNKLLSEFWRELSTISGKAGALGHYQVFHGNYEKLFLQPELVEAITTEDLRAVATDVFRASNMTVGVLRDPAAGVAQ
jgi:zinc protease